VEISNKCPFQDAGSHGWVVVKKPLISGSDWLLIDNRVVIKDLWSDKSKYKLLSNDGRGYKQHPEILSTVIFIRFQ
jgi:hypothetical protein